MRPCARPERKPAGERNSRPGLARSARSSVASPNPPSSARARVAPTPAAPVNAGTPTVPPVQETGSDRIPRVGRGCCRSSGQSMLGTPQQPMGAAREEDGGQRGVGRQFVKGLNPAWSVAGETARLRRGTQGCRAGTGAKPNPRKSRARAHSGGSTGPDQRGPRRHGRRAHGGGEGDRGGGVGGGNQWAGEPRKPSSVPARRSPRARETVIPLGPPLPAASSNLPGDGQRRSADRDGRPA